MKLLLLPGLFAVCQLDPNAPLPAWATSGSSTFVSITRTRSELSIVCAQEKVRR